MPGTQAPSPRGLARAAVLRGAALGGFFNGILLHQILQWHHLLSNVEGAAFQDLRMQLLPTACSTRGRADELGNRVH